MRYYKLALCILATTLFFAACEGADQNLAVIKVGLRQNYPPYSYTAAKDKELTGFDVELLEQLTQVNSSLDFDLIPLSNEQLVPSLDKDDVQVLSNWSLSVQSGATPKYVASTSYHLASMSIVTNKTVTGIKSLKDLAGKKVAVDKSTAFASFLDSWNGENGKRINTVYYANFQLADLLRNRVTAVLGDTAQAQTLQKQGLAITVVEPIVASNPLSFVCKNDAEGVMIKKQLDRALKKLRSNGELAKLEEKYFGK